MSYSSCNIPIVLSAQRHSNASYILFKVASFLSYHEVSGVLLGHNYAPFLSTVLSISAWTKFAASRQKSISLLVGLFTLVPWANPESHWRLVADSEMEDLILLAVSSQVPAIKVLSNDFFCNVFFLCTSLEYALPSHLPFHVIRCERAMHRCKSD